MKIKFNLILASYFAIFVLLVTFAVVNIIEGRYLDAIVFIFGSIPVGDYLLIVIYRAYKKIDILKSLDEV